MNTLRKQRGITLLGWFLIIMMVTVIGMAALKLAPAYMEYNSLVSVLETMENDPSLKDVTKNQIAESFGKHRSLNNIDSVKKDSFTIKKMSGQKGYKIDVNYEVRKHLMWNLYIVATFERSAKVGG